MRRLSLPIVILLSIIIAACLTGLALAQGAPGAAKPPGPPQPPAASSIPVPPAAPQPPVPPTYRPREEGQPESTPLGPFKRIEISGAAVLTLVQDTNGPLVATVPQTTGTHVNVKVRNETLLITSADGSRWWGNLFGRGPAPSVQLTVHFKDLESIEASGGIKILARSINVPVLRIEGSGGTTIQIDDLRATRLTVDGAGALKAEITGQVTDQNLSISGAADYQAAKLVSDNAAVDVSGAGKIVVNARKQLKVSVSGAGVVEYLGDPVVQESLSGAGRLKRRESADASQPHVALAD